MHIDIQPFAEYAVAPYVGAWIETVLMFQAQTETETSHPTWVRGLKLFRISLNKKRQKESHPTWVRGLKHN